MSGVSNYKSGHLSKEVAKATGFKEDLIFIEEFTEEYIDYVIYEKDKTEQSSKLNYVGKGRLERTINS